METSENTTQKQLVTNLLKIMRDRKITQAALADYMDMTPSQLSRILNGSLNLSLSHISNLASNLSLRVIDIFTYPEKYVCQTKTEEEPIEAILQIRLTKDKKDQVMKLVFGDNNIEILNK